MRPQLHKQRTTSRSSGKTVNGRKDLATINPALAAESDGSWDPSTVTSGSALRVGWICRKNSAHRWTAPVSQRVSGTGCPVCVNRIIIPGVNDLATTHPELANAGDGTWDPTRYVSGSHTKLNWICSVDPRHVYLCSVNERARGVGCSLCNGKVVKAGVNDLGTLDPALAAENDGTWEPSTMRQFSNERVGWVCSTNPDHRWFATIANRSNGGGCPGCATSGYDRTAPGWLYLVADPDRELQQVGISNYPEQRLAHHRRNGWVTLDVIGPLDGDLCYNWEQSIVRYVRASGVAEPALAGRFEGFTEAWSTTELRVTSVRELRESVLADEASDEPKVSGAD